MLEREQLVRDEVGRDETMTEDHQPEEESAREVGGPLTPEAMRAMASPQTFQRVRQNLIGVLQQGFEQIESAGFDNDAQMEEDWKNVSALVLEGTRDSFDASPR